MTQDSQRLSTQLPQPCSYHKIDCHMSQSALLDFWNSTDNHLHDLLLDEGGNGRSHERESLETRVSANV